MSRTPLDPRLDASVVPAGRVQLLRTMAAVIAEASRVLLTTHVNADGDGTGSQAALAAWLSAAGKTVWIANPTAYPDAFRHLIRDPSWIADPGTPRAIEARDADLVIVLDTGEPSRIGRVGDHIGGKQVIVLDHHLASEPAIQGIVLQDASACATGELVYDLLTVQELPRPWPDDVLEGIYTAIVTDTGSFRFSNSTPRAHALAGELIAQGVDPEAVYRRIFANVPLRRIQLLRHALDNLQIDEELPITWITIERGVMEALGTNTDDLEGVVEHARSIEGTEVALLFRATSDGATKISFRSSGAVNVNAIAREFGGGGHVKASGALVGKPLGEVRPRVLEATRSAVRAAGLTFRATQQRR